MKQARTNTEREKAVVTGASSGIGAVYAARLAARGYDLILIARRGDRLSTLAERLQHEFNVVVQCLTLDLGKPSDLAAAVEAIRDTPGVTLLVNNAGAARLLSVDKTGASDSEIQIDLNAVALTDLSFAALKVFKTNNKGTLINIGSVLSFHSMPNSAIYSGTKGYVMNFTRSLQRDVEGTEVIVQLVLPATTATEIWETSGIPMSALNQDTIMSAEDCVDAALAGLDQGESVTLPSVEDPSLWAEYDEVRQRMFRASQVGKPASRYGVHRSS